MNNDREKLADELDAHIANEFFPRFQSCGLLRRAAAALRERIVMADSIDKLNEELKQLKIAPEVVVEHDAANTVTKIDFKPVDHTINLTVVKKI